VLVGQARIACPTARTVLPTDRPDHTRNLVLQGVVMSATTASLHTRIDQLARLQSEVLGEGITREVYTAAYSEATALVAEWMHEAGLETRVDSAGNLFGSWRGSDGELPAIWTGSHFDTTLNAGAYDGVLGVLGAITALSQLRQAGFVPRRTVEVIGIAGEEPRFGAGCIGSRAMIGALQRGELDTMADRNGVTLAAAMRSVGLDPDRIAEAQFDPAAVAAFVELHIEQGAVLEQHGTPIGVVEQIAAPHQLRLTLTGEARHAGSTPMALRRDALAGAAEVILAVERLARESVSGTTVGTVGTVAVAPGAVNVIPGTVTLDIDVRDVVLDAREQVVSAVHTAIDELSARRGLSAELREMVFDRPAPCDPQIVATVRAVCDELGAPYLDMASGAYHDAMVLGAKVPIGMIFVPSRAGLSHHPDEYTAPAELDLGVKVLAGTLAKLAA
jgi:hydantoinase/carbamoylase family amidase